jgi:acetolactate synthase-1/2/3 large subunit
MNVAGRVAEFLAEAGVPRVFGVPGTETIELIEAIRRTGINFNLTSHEATATFCAAMTGHLTGIPGVSLVAGGPGTTNTTSGIFVSHMDRMPLALLIGDHVAHPALPTHQRLPFEHVAPSILRAKVAASAPDFTDKLPSVFRAAHSPWPGPVAVSVSTADALRDSPAITGVVPALQHGEREPELTEMVDCVRNARRPLLVIGLGVTWADHGERLVRLAEHLRAPVADTAQSKGWFPNDNRLYLGTVTTRNNLLIRSLLEDSDLILALGLDSVELLSEWSTSTTVVGIAEANANDDAIPKRLAVTASLDASMDKIMSEVPARAGDWFSDRVKLAREAIRQALQPSGSPSAGTMWPQTVVDELQAVFPADGVIATDVGSHKLLMLQQWQSVAPNTFLNSSGLSSMGTGLAFAMAAKLAAPNTVAGSVIGDGGFLMYAGEMATLATIPGPLVVVVMNDGALSSIRIKQIRRDYPAIGTALAGADCEIASTANSLGVAGIRATSRSALHEALRHAVAHEKPVVIEAIVDPAGYELSQ